MRQSLIIATGAWSVVAALGVAAQDRTAKQESRPSAQPSNASAKAEYPLTPKCGPWMVMVKSFQGPEAVVYANKLASELREKHKIVAYTFVKQPEQPKVQQVGYVRGRIRQYPSAAVLAGDCKNEKVAAKLKEQIRQIRPSSITADMVPNYEWELRAAGKSVRTAEKPEDTAYQFKAGALRTAFCLPNPLAPAQPSKPDTLLAKLNSGRHSIYNCPGEYSLQAIAFSGGVAFTRPQAELMDKSKMLELAGERAEVVCEELIKRGFDAYTYHGTNFSSVAVGSFASPQDPQIAELRTKLTGMQIGSFRLTATQCIKVPRR